MQWTLIVIIISKILIAFWIKKNKYKRQKKTEIDNTVKVYIVCFKLHYWKLCCGNIIYFISN